MRECPKCKRQLDEEFFFKWHRQNYCRTCVEMIVNNRRVNGVTDSKRPFIDARHRNRRVRKAIANVVAQFQQNGEPYVYLVKSDRAYKIGFSKQVADRVKALSTGHPVPLTLVAVAPGGLQLEREIHAEFARFRIRLEWFQMKPEILAAFAALPGSLVFLPGYMTSEAPPPAASV